MGATLMVFVCARSSHERKDRTDGLPQLDSMTESTIGPLGCKDKRDENREMLIGITTRNKCR
jgi:hypothetical protein